MKIKSVKRNRRRLVGFLLIAGTVISNLHAGCLEAFSAETDADEVLQAEEIRPSDLYAGSAVLMDADSGRILFSKNGTEEAPMASTTKIMTCILALEKGSPSDVVTVSREAASQPEVHLGMQEGQSFYLKDLLYSLMLESHNDTAVAVAEHIAGSVDAFARIMNEKAAEIGCRQTYYITPNGLDARDETGIHHTTASDLALVMKYCIMDSACRDEFLEVTRTDTYTFSDVDETASYACRNHNAFLNMMEGALTGKTGFTADAGYCYVGALRKDDRTFIVALLACGWPDHKSYKWSDTRKLMQYGLDSYHYREILPGSLDVRIPVAGGYTEGYPDAAPVEIRIRTEGTGIRLLLREDEKPEMKLSLPDQVDAPVSEGEVFGKAEYTVNGTAVASFPAVSADSVGKRTAAVCFSYIIDSFLLSEIGC